MTTQRVRQRARGACGHARGVDETQVQIRLSLAAGADEEMAEIQVAVVQPAGVKQRGQLRSRGEQAIEREAGLEKFVGRGIVGEVVEDDEAAVVGKVSPPDEFGSRNLLLHCQIVCLDFVVGRKRKDGTRGEALDMPAGGLALVVLQIDVAVFAVGQLSPDVDVRMVEDRAGVQPAQRAGEQSAARDGSGPRTNQPLRSLPSEKPLI